jgi:putative oxidoreductase
MSTTSYPTSSADPKPVIPSLGRYYPFLSDLAYVILRVAAGLWLLPHGWQKVQLGAQAVAANVLARRGIEPALFWAYVIMILETLGGILIVIGLFTRPVALLLFIEFLVIVFKAHLPNGWSPATGGAEFVAIWCIIWLVILLRGGGPWSLDRKLGWEI